MRTWGTRGPVVVLVHGGPGAPGTLAPLARALSDSCRVFEPFQRRSGDAPLTVDLHVDDLERVVSSVRGDAAPIVVGWSWGAMLALAWAARYPGSAGPIALVGGGTWDEEARDLLRRTVADRLGETEHALLERLAREVPDEDERLARYGSLLRTAYNVDPVEEEPAGMPFDGPGHVESWNDLVRLQHEGVYPAAFAAIRSPVLMVHGDADPHPALPIRDALLPHLPQVEFHLLEDCGHEPWMERRAREPFLGILRGWIARQAAVSGSDGTKARPWEADHSISPERAARRIESRCPDLAPARLADLGTGWDNDAWLVNDEWVFRFPRRDVARDLILTEVDVLPRLAPLLPVAVPVPLHVGDPDPHYPYPWAGYRRIPGETACRAGLDDAARAALARPLGELLRALHAVDPGEVGPRLPGDLIGRTDLRGRLRGARIVLDRDTQPRSGVSRDEVDALLASLVDTPAHGGPPCVVHGDLYARHVLVDGERLCGVIDWGDVHRGDPALDLSVGWSFLGPGAREDFLDAYGGVDAATRDRARFRALTYGVLLTDYGASIGDGPLEEAGRTALRNAMA